MSSFPRIIMPVGVLILFFYCCAGTCEFCSYTNQTTTHSKCSETCGGGERYYFHYVCCTNFTKPECERKCNISLTLTKSVKIVESCNKKCSKGGTYNDTTERCDCPEGTGGRCCNQYVKRSIGRKSPYLTVGLPLGLILLLAIVVVIVYGWCMNRRRNLRVDITNTGSGEKVQGYSNI